MKLADEIIGNSLFSMLEVVFFLFVAAAAGS